MSNECPNTNDAVAALQRDHSVPSLERGMAILELISRQPQTLGLIEIASTLALPNNAVFRITGALVQLGYLYRDPKTRKFSITSRLLSMGLRRVHENDIVERSHDLLRRLRDEVRETVALGAVLRDEAVGVVLAQVDCCYPFGYRLQAGHRWDLYCTGPGKAILAFLPPAEYRELLERMSFKRYTANTITKCDVLERNLEEIRQVGYALDGEECVVGCHCVASPVFDVHHYPVAAIWASGPSDRLTSAQFPAVGQTVKRYAALISERLGVPG
jgi:DNA-binding IclR family transcriptional regulator